MNTLSKVACLALFTTTPFALNSCSATAKAVDDTPLEFTREQYVEQISDEACDRFEECGKIGDGQLYANEDECESKMESNFYELWPEAQCGDDKITGSTYKACYDQAHDFTCETGLNSVDDYMNYISNCNASQVCTDAG